METLTVTKTIIDNRPLTVAEEWIVDEIVLFVENTEKFYLGLVAKCNMAMADLEKGKYKESRQIENVMYVVDSAVAEYRRTIGKGKFSELNGKVQRRIKYRAAVELYNNVMGELGYTEKIRGEQRRLEI